MSTSKLTDGTFETEVLNTKGTVLVDFWAEWCGPCRALGPKLEEISDEMAGKVKIMKLNVDENRESAARFGVRSIPMMVIFKDGQVVDQMIGNLPKEDIQSKLTAHI
jgi:thioredoxin 1